MKKDIEQQLKETLGSRAITPSAEAWERLALNRQRAKKETGSKNRKYSYYASAVAACLILAGSLFFTGDNGSTSPVIAPAAVNANREIKTVPAALPQPQVIYAAEAVAVKETVPSVSKTGQIAKADIAQEKAQQMALATAGVQMGNEGLAPAVTLVNLPLPVSKEDEADLLLANAYKNIGTQKQLAQPTNDTTLLKEVEAEMNDYYRDKAMRFFALKHKTIRFAVRDKE